MTCRYCHNPATTQLAGDLDLGSLQVCSACADGILANRARTEREGRFSRAVADGMALFGPERERWLNVGEIPAWFR